MIHFMCFSSQLSLATEVHSFPFHFYRHASLKLDAIRKVCFKNVVSQTTRFGKILLKNIHLNGHNIGFQPRTQK